MPTRKHKSQLQAILNFTDEDLDANREGDLSKTQEKYLNWQAIKFGFLAHLPALLLAIKLTDFVFVDSFKFLGVLTSGIILGYGAWLKSWLNFGEDSTSKVASAEGLIWLDNESFRFSYPMHIGGESFKISSKACNIFDELRKEHKQWLIYYAPNIKTILSAEPLLEEGTFDAKT